MIGKRAMKKILASLVLISVSLFFFCPLSIAQENPQRQPYEKNERWSWILPIKSAGWCGPTSLYHVISYYGDYGSYYYRVKSLFRSYWGPGTIDLPVITMANLMFIGETAFGVFIQPSQNGSGWSLLDNVADLYYSKDLNDRVYNVYVCYKYTKPEEIDARRKRLDYILENALLNDTPVIVHLVSGIPGMGHYITVVGYDKKKSIVYYVDSLQSDKGIIEVDAEDFLGKKFYRRGMLYNARWDGEWMAFWHTENGVLCRACSE